VLNDWSGFELDDSIYLPAATEASLDVTVNVLPADRFRKRSFEGQDYFLGIEQVRDVIEGFEAQIGRTATLNERLRAVVHYARYDAFIDPDDAVDG
jgi:hypothetical protein